MMRMTKTVGVLALALAAGGACGGGGPGTSEADVMKYLGTWSYTGQNTLTCSGTPSTESESGTLGIARGTSSPLTVTNSNPPCSFGFNAAGGVATVQPGQTTCALSTTGGQVLTYTYDSWKLTSPNGTTGTYTQSGMYVLSSSSGGQSTCTITASGTITKQ
jgi:ABC-type transport system substrate-binding protein